MDDLQDVVSNEVITAARQNLINEYIEKGTHKINTKSIDIQGAEVIKETGHIEYSNIDNVPDFLNKTTDTTDDITEGSTNKFDVPVVLNEGTNVTISGTYPEFTISSTDTGVDELEELIDVDVTDKTLNDTLKYDGTKWVAVPEGTSFTFAIASFVDDQSATQLIGSGVWKTISGINFTAGYTNGPPTAAYISSSSWVSNLNLSSPFTNIASAEATNYPATKDSSISFTLYATKGSTLNSGVSVTFRNNIKYGASVETTWDSTDIVGLSGTSLSNTYVGSYSTTSGASEYILFAHPSSYTTLNDNGFLYNGITCPFETPVTVSVTNSAGFTENYKVYRSTNSNLGTSTLTTSTSASLLNRIYYGVSTKANTYSESDVEGLASSVISNTKGRTINLTADATYYIIYALPVRLGTVTFWVGGFEGGFQSPETISVTNVNGYTEDYYVYRSTNSGLGLTSVVVV